MTRALVLTASFALLPRVLDEQHPSCSVIIFIITGNSKIRDIFTEISRPAGFDTYAANCSIHKLVSVWSRSCTSNITTWSYDIIYYHWRLCQQIWLFQAWRSNGQRQSGNRARVTITAAAIVWRFWLKIVTDSNPENSLWVHCGTIKATCVSYFDGEIKTKCRNWQNYTAVLGNIYPCLQTLLSTQTEKNNLSNNDIKCIWLSIYFCSIFFCLLEIKLDSLFHKVGGGVFSNGNGNWHMLFFLCRRAFLCRTMYFCVESSILVSNSFIVSNECYTAGINRDTSTITIRTQAAVALTTQANCFGKE